MLMKPAKMTGRMLASVPPAIDHVGIVAQDRLERLAHRVAARGAGAGDGHVRAFGAERDRDQARRRVGQEVRQEHRRHAVWAALEQDLLLA